MNKTDGRTEIVQPLRWTKVSFYAVHTEMLNWILYILHIYSIHRFNTANHGLVKVCQYLYKSGLDVFLVI